MISLWVTPWNINTVHLELLCGPLHSYKVTNSELPDLTDFHCVRDLHFQFASSDGWQEVMANRRNFTPTSLTSCQVCVCCVGPQKSLWLMLATLQCAAILPKQFKCQASGSVIKRLPHWVQLYRHQAGWAAECTQSIENRRWFDTPSLRVDSARSSSGNFTGVAQSSQELTWPLCYRVGRMRKWTGGMGVEGSQLAAGAFGRQREICGVAPPIHWAGISQGVWRLWG